MGLFELLVLVLVVFLIITVLPRWGHSANWGYGPAGLLGFVLLILLILILLGRFPRGGW